MNGGASSFDRFALQGSSNMSSNCSRSSSASSSTSSASSASEPERKQPIKMNKRVIQCSDDEDDDIVIVKSKPVSVSIGSDWLEARDSKTMSEAEKERNIKIAQQERNPSKIAKRPRLVNDSDNDDDVVYSKKDEIETFRKIDYSAKSSQALDNSLLEDTPDAKIKVRETAIDLDVVKRKERDIRLKNRAADLEQMEEKEQKEEKVPKKSKSSESKKQKKSAGVIDLAGSDDEAEAGGTSDDDDDDDDDNGGAGGWRDDRTKSDVQEKAMSVLRYCETIGETLRKNLRSWAEQGDEATPNANPAAKAASSSFCTGLMNIKKRSRGDEDDGQMKVLNDDYFTDVCPGLLLKAYQLVGVNWLKLLHENDINGVLADDMGLGKTVQSIAFLGWLKTSRPVDEDKHMAHLIVVPASTLANWENELRRFCPLLNVVTYHGTQNERADLRHDLKIDIRAGRVDVVLSTFTIFEREACKEDRSFIYKQAFEYLIVDEAHCLKVSKSARFMNMNAIKSGHRLLLSGTPVQNDLGELLSLMSFTMPKLFRNIDIDEVLEGFGWDKRSGVPSSSSSAVSINQLRSMLAPFVLRRVKTDVLDQLPDKESFLEKVQMTSFQNDVYDNILCGHARRKEMIRAKVASEILIDSLMHGTAKKGRVTSRAKELLDLTSPEAPAKKTGTKDKDAPTESDTMVVRLTKDTGEVLSKVNAADAERIVHELSASEAANLFTALRKAANHPLLLRVRYMEETVMKKIAEVSYAEGRFGYQCDLKRVRDEVEKFSDFDLHQLCLEFPALHHLQLDATALYDSQKMQKLKEMLPALVAEGHRVLVFSQWTRLLDLLEVLLYDIGMRFLRLDGSTPVKIRQDMIDEFSAEGSLIPVFLLSTKAGGLGINLTAADTVIMHDLDFNPENDRQAEDRCHRIGQTKPVKVYRLVTADTVDEDIYEMGERKRQLTAAVLSDHHGVKKGKKSKEGLDGEADIGAIGRILQRALQKRTREAEEKGAGGGVRVIERTIYPPSMASKGEGKGEGGSAGMVTAESNSSLSSSRTSIDALCDDLSQPSVDN